MSDQHKFNRLERRINNLEAALRHDHDRRKFRGTSQVYRVVKPIKPGEYGTGVLMYYSFKQVGSPAKDEGWVDFDPNDNERGAVDILDSEYQTLAMPGAMIRAESYLDEHRTIGEYGITNVRVKAIADVTANTEGEYQIIDGGPQVYDGSPVTIKATLPKGVSTGSEFLFSFDRVAREWYEVETGGVNLIIARADEDVHNSYTPSATFSAKYISTLIGATLTPGQAITVKNLDMGEIQRPDSSFAITDGQEYVFALLEGMKFLAVQCDDGQWQIVQSGGVLEDYDWYDSGGPGPVEP